MLCLCALIDGADLALLPSSFRALEVDLGFTPGRLAALSVTQGFAVAISGPVWGGLADSGASRKRLLIAGCSAWGLLLMVLALVSDFRMIMVLRLLNGVALGMLTPVVQSIVHEEAAEEETGLWFGCIDFSKWTVGMAPSLVLCTAISGHMYRGIQGWRIAFCVVAFASFVVAGVIRFGMHEKPRNYNGEKQVYTTQYERLVALLQIKSFRIIVAQCMFGAIPQCSISFLPMYFQYRGIPDAHAGALCGTALVMGGFGMALGGVLGDRASRRFGLPGRPCVGQFSVLFCVLCWGVFFLAAPAGTGERFYFVVLPLVALLGQWASSGCNKPVLLQVVPPGMVSAAVAWSQCLEGIAGQVGGPASIGFMSEHLFHYDKAAEGMDFDVMPVAVRKANVTALSRSLCITIFGANIVCFLLFSLLHWTYASDLKRRAYTKSLDEATPFAS